MKGQPYTPSRAFRKKSPAERRAELESSHMDRDLVSFLVEGDMSDLAQVMVENAVGTMALPLGLATGFVIDQVPYALPLATEEPSVIAAASYGGTIVARHGGFSTTATKPLTSSHIYLEGGNPDTCEIIRDFIPELESELAPLLAPMTARGGGLRGIDAQWLAELAMVRVDIWVDTRDAMGANLVNSAAERLRGPLEARTGTRVLMAILTNESKRRLASACFEIPVENLARGGFDGRETARRIEMGSQVAQLDPTRAVTHNKGIMNGISALALATGNDTRAIEAAAHRYASRSGSYRGLSHFYRAETQGRSVLVGELELPLSMGTVGGAAGFHPISRLALEILGNPSSMDLARIAASLGLAQNFAALWALVTEGIQQGHMALHAKRLAYSVGARGAEIGPVAQSIKEGGVFNREAAAQVLGIIRDNQ